MTSIPDQPGESFKLSQLIYDTRYRSLTIQAVAFILLMSLIFWLGANTVRNLASLGKDFDFGFLGNRSGYDISQRLVAYTSDSTHARAALVGILNTLLLAVLGCILATVIGVLAGVARLSKNWIVARLMAIYVEGFRNVPLLLWIVLIFAIFSESLPHPREFRPDPETGIAESAMWFFDSVAITRQGTYIPRLVYAEGSWLFVVALALAGGGIWYLRRRARLVQQDTGEVRPVFLPSLGILLGALIVSFVAITLFSRSNPVALVAVGAENGQSLAAYAEAQGRVDLCRIRGAGASYSLQRYLDETETNYRIKEYFGPRDATSELLQERCQLYAVPAARVESVVADLEARGPSDLRLGILEDRVSEGVAVQLDSPAISESGIPRFEGGIQIRNPLLALWLALSLYTGAFIAEIVRGGILAVSKGQTEAAYALGLRPGRTMSLVILPQALRVIIPPLISQYLNLTKNSSLAIAVGYMDVRSTLGGITINQTGRELEGMLLLGCFYLLASLVISGALNFFNNRVKLRER